MSNSNSEREGQVEASPKEGVVGAVNSRWI